MKKRIDDFDEIDRLKEIYRRRIGDQELRIRSDFREFTDNITGAALLNRVRENLFTGPGFAFKLGFMAVTLLRKRLSERKATKRR
jgi:hypothetical protein